jgi:hypothetical protein
MAVLPDNCLNQAITLIENFWNFFLGLIIRAACIRF